jgi:ribosomal-protein-alanine N-acetyltransferase
MIVVAGPAYASVMAAMHRLAFPPHEAWSAVSFAAQLGAPGGFGLIHPNGFALARAIAGEAELLTLVVVPDARRGGIGRALLGQTLVHAKSLGAEALFLEVAESNLAAQALYAGAGAQAVGRRSAYYASGDDALLLRIALRA